MSKNSQYILDVSDQGVVFISEVDKVERFGDTFSEDYRVTLCVDDQDKIIGMTLDGMSELPRKDWFAHPVRNVIPINLRVATDSWYLIDVDRRPKSTRLTS